jgi:hypothetical protein
MQATGSIEHRDRYDRCELLERKWVVTGVIASCKYDTHAPQASVVYGSFK